MAVSYTHLDVYKRQAPYRVTVQTSRSVEELEQNLTVKSVYDIR